VHQECASRPEEARTAWQRKPGSTGVSLAIRNCAEWLQALLNLLHSTSTRKAAGQSLSMAAQVSSAVQGCRRGALEAASLSPTPGASIVCHLLTIDWGRTFRNPCRTGSCLPMRCAGGCAAAGQPGQVPAGHAGAAPVALGAGGAHAAAAAQRCSPAGPRLLPGALPAISPLHV
jgi:hypothetical protein